jgi:D-glycerate 3-kinase
MTGRALEAVEKWIAGLLAGMGDTPLLVGLCGAQGSGKSTLSGLLTARLARAGVQAATLSIDDLYLTIKEREHLARHVHPLLITRGVPGTHDVALGIKILDAIRAGAPTSLPRFEKARDDRAPGANWHRVTGKLKVLVFEGWCVGARPQSGADLRVPVNDLERDEDTDGRWRAYVNAALAESYQALFARLHRLVLLAAPSFEIVACWRGQQEADLRRVSPAAACAMDDKTLRRFLDHYERLTRHILMEMPARADLVLRLSADRDVLAIEGTGNLSAVESSSYGCPASRIGSD